MNRFETLARFVLAHRGAVALAWAALLAIAAVPSLLLPGVVQGSSESIRGSESDRVVQIVQREFGEGSAFPIPVVVESQQWTADDPRFADAVRALAGFLEARPDVRSVRHYWNTPVPELLGAERRSALVIVTPVIGSFTEAETYTARLREQISQAGLPAGISTAVTGIPAMFHDLNRNSSEDLLRAEKVGLPLTLAILLLVFGAPLAAGLSITLALTAVTLACAGLYLCNLWMPVSAFALNTVSMIGLGAGVDYALFLLYRYRRELAQGRGVRDAVVHAAAATGPAVVVSGVAVAVGFVALLLADVAFLRGLVVGGVLVILAAVAGTLTLLPVCIDYFGGAVIWPADPRRPSPARVAAEIRWGRWARAAMAHPWLALVLGLAAIGVVAAPALHLKSWNVGVRDLPAQFEARRGFDRLAAQFQPGWMGPVVLALQAPPGQNLLDEQRQRAVLATAERLGRDARVTAVEHRPAVNPRGDTALIVALPAEAPETAAMMELVRDLRAERWAEARAAGITVNVGGASALIYDFDARIFDSLWRVVPAVLAITFCVLLFFFGSPAIALKAVALNLLSVLAAYGFLVLVFQDGAGARLLALDPPGGLNSFIVLMLFTILFGLSMDYEVFLLRQIQEEYRRTGDNAAAVAAGLARSAGLISSAAAIMVVLFGSFGLTELTATREFGIGLAFAVALDATLIRLLVVPAAMVLLGRLNWWCPAWMRRGRPPVALGAQA